MMKIIIAGSHFKDIKCYIDNLQTEFDVQFVEAESLEKHIHLADVLIPTMVRIDAPLLKKATRLKLIHQWGAGLEGVDIECATRNRIMVANVPTVGTGNAESCAEWCIMASIALSRYYPKIQEQVKNGWEWGSPTGNALYGKTAGVIGYGGIGKALCSRLKAFGMKIKVVKRIPGAASQEKEADWVRGMEELPVLLKESDYVFLAVPLNADTLDLISWDQFSLMKKTSYLLNPARGAVVNESALLDALNKKKIAGAALDVFWKEPIGTDNPVIQHPNVLSTPHIAGSTDISYQRIVESLIPNIQRVLKGGKPHNWANPF